MRFITLLMLDKIKNIALIVLTGIIIVLWLFKSCKPKPITPINIPELKKQDSFRTVIRYHDSTKVKTIIDHRTKVTTILKDSTKCYTEILYIAQSCEDVIKADSVLIGSLKNLVSLDSVIQIKLFDRVYKDSVLIVKLNKKVRRNKVLAKVAFVTGLLGGGFVGFKVKS